MDDVSSRPIYANRWIRVREDIAEMPDGHAPLRRHRGAAAVGIFRSSTTTPCSSSASTARVRPLLLGDPTGCAVICTRASSRRSGARAGRGNVLLARDVEKVCTFHSRACSARSCHVYICQGGTRARARARHGDATEFIELRTFPFDDVVRMVERSEIQDAITIVRRPPRRPTSTTLTPSARRRGHAAAGSSVTAKTFHGPVVDPAPPTRRGAVGVPSKTPAGFGVRRRSSTARSALPAAPAQAVT